MTDSVNSRDVILPNQPIAAQRLAEVGSCRLLMVEADLGNLEVHTEQLGYHLKDETLWWDIVWNSGFRGLVEKIPAERMEAFKAEHLTEVRKLVTDKGLWLNVEVIFSVGSKS